MSNNNKSVGQAIGEKLKSKILTLMDEKPAEEKKPSNIGLGLAWLGFNFVYLFLDIGTSVMVGTLTNPYYGLMTFAAGIAPFGVNEALFMRAYNSSTQKTLSILGAALSILSTILLALLVGGLNAVEFFQIATLPPETSTVLELALLGGLVLSVGLHGLIWIVFFFSDNGIKTKQVHTRNQAAREEKKFNLAMAKDDVDAYIALAKEVDEYEQANQLEVLSKAFEKLTGQSLTQAAQTQQQNNQPKQQQYQEKPREEHRTPEPVKQSDNGVNPTVPPRQS